MEELEPQDPEPQHRERLDQQPDTERGGWKEPQKPQTAAEEERSHQGQKWRPWKRPSQRNPQWSPVEQSKTEGELMQRTTPEGQRQEKRVQQRSVRTLRQPWNPRTTREEPKACAEETGHGKEAEGKREAPRHPEAGKEIEKKEEPGRSRRQKSRGSRKGGNPGGAGATTGAEPIADNHPPLAKTPEKERRSYRNSRGSGERRSRKERIRRARGGDRSHRSKGRHRRGNRTKNREDRRDRGESTRGIR